MLHRSGNLQCASTARRKKGHTQVVRIFVFLLLSLDDRMLTCDLFLFYSRSLNLRVKELILSKCYNNCDYYNYYYYYYYYYYYHHHHHQMTFSHVLINLKLQFPPPLFTRPLGIWTFEDWFVQILSPPPPPLPGKKLSSNAPANFSHCDFLHIDQTLQPTSCRPFLLSICSQK